MDDYISLYIYGWDKDKEDIKLLFWKRNNHLEIPKCKISDINFAKKPPNKFNHLAKSFLNSEGCSDNVDVSLNRCNAVQNNWPTDFIEIHWTGAVEELWSKISKNEVKRSSARLIDLLRVYSIPHNQYFSHASFAVQVQAIEKLHGKHDNVVFHRKNLKSKSLERYKINLTIEQLLKFVEGSHSKKNVGGNEIAPGATFEEISPHITFSEEGKHINVISTSALFDSLGYTQSDKEVLYEEFVRLSFPFRTITFNEIKPLLTLLGQHEKEADIFRALDEHHSGELDIYQFMTGLTAMDPFMQHGQGPAEFRCRLIFRYYDEDFDGFLDEKEVTKMVRDISRLLKQNLSEDKLKASVQNAFKIFAITPPEKVPILNFLTSVGSLRFRGTSLLFRASENVPAVIRRYQQQQKQECSSAALKGVASQQQQNNTLPMGLNATNDHNMGQRNKDSTDQMDAIFNDEYSWNSSGYSLAEHTVKVRRSGAISNTTNLLDMERAGEVGNTGLETLHEDEVAHHVSPDISTNFVKHKVKKQFSAQAFNVKSLPNEILSALRYFEHELPDKNPMDWGLVDKGKLMKYTIAICENVKLILESEPRLLNISSPCYVLGDLHGNFKDLICFEKALWRLGPHLTPANFLFLGDYVDRGLYGIEVVLYLFAQKLKAPNRFFLLRGNHEVREIQQFFSFFTECCSAFGNQLGPVVWEEINKVFDRMPLAAVVDKKIFCIHGGVPNLNESPLLKINHIPCPLPQPERESPLAWQMMWNDPVDLNCLNDELKQQLVSNQGFADNVKRQTAFVFNEEAFDRFLKANNLTHVIRAHEVKQAGFEIQQSGRLMTVFSSSQYCGMNNEAACVLIHDMRIRIIRVDTT